MDERTYKIIDMIEELDYLISSLYSLGLELDQAMERTDQINKLLEIKNQLKKQINQK